MSNPAIANTRPVAYWLLTLCALVFAMVVLGGVTRLTGSGLSMVNWEPLMGIVPPLSSDAWQRSFEQYQLFPEYQKLNSQISLADYKSIFWFEYSHRLLGRSIGIVFLLPFIYFLIKGNIRAQLVPKLLTMFVFGGLQGLLGWYMVKSGLVNNPHVSQYRLSAHLLLAFLIYAYMLWVALGLLLPRPMPRVTAKDRRLTIFTWAVLVLIVITITSGGFVAGLKAGHVSDTFPLMYGSWVPEQIYTRADITANVFEDPITVQFNHRVIAVTTFLFVIVLCVGGLRKPRPIYTRPGFVALFISASAQVGLGISTIITHVPITLAVAHQAGALVLLTSIVFVCRTLKAGHI